MLQGGFIKVWLIDWPWIWVSTWILRFFPGQLLFHPLKLSCEGRSTGPFIATTNCQQATQAGCVHYWYAVPRRIFSFLFSFFGITPYSLSFVTQDSQGVVNKPFPLCASDIYLPSATGNGQLRAASQRDVVQLHRAMIDLCRIFEKVLLSL